MDHTSEFSAKYLVIQKIRKVYKLITVGEKKKRRTIIKKRDSLEFQTKIYQIQKWTYDKYVCVLTW